jgi:hypothetical protein
MKNAPNQVSNVYGTLYPKKFNPTSSINGTIVTANTDTATITIIKLSFFIIKFNSIYKKYAYLPL